DGPGGGGEAIGVGEDAGGQGADGEAAVAPEPVDADGAGPPGGVGEVADDGEQGGVDHGGAGAEQDLGDRPDAEGGGHGDESEGSVGGAEQERLWPESGVGGDGAGGEGGGGQGGVPGGLVEAHGQAASARAGQVDLHDDRGGPGQALVEAE